jgi:hypothetical protein
MAASELPAPRLSLVDQRIGPEDVMVGWSHIKRTALLGLAVGLIFGSVNLVMTWLNPLAEDTPAALLQFYGPMWTVWALASFGASRRTGRLWSGIISGLTVAFATFVTYDLLILVRVNLFLQELTERADWQNMMMRYLAGDIDSLRLFVNVDYLTGAPLKLGVSCAIGAVMGSMGGFLGQLSHRRIGRITATA